MTSEEPVSVSAAELRDAFEFVNFGGTGEQCAYISLDTGRIYCKSDYIDDDDEEEPLPEDVENSDRYIQVPDKRELDLGRDLVFDFVEQER